MRRLKREFTSGRVRRRIRVRDIGLASAGVLLGAGTITVLDMSETPHRVTGPAVFYANCRDAIQNGVAPIRRGQPGYRPALDADDDGIACEPFRRR